MSICIENIPRFINQWGVQLQPHPDYQPHFEIPFIGKKTFYFEIKISFCVSFFSFFKFRSAAATYLVQPPTSLSSSPSRLSSPDRTRKIDPKTMESDGEST